MAKSEKMYANPPKAERGEDGKTTVKKPTKADKVQSGTDGMAMEVHQAHERRSMHHRHETEHMAMHHQHETEHMAHDTAKGGEKAKMHEKHESEMQEMHKRHHGERKKMHARHEKGETAAAGGAEVHKEKPSDGGKEKKAKSDGAGLDGSKK